ncbi:hypothetical protein ACWD25_54750 [Streptomyces sp. NPDC002920]
MTLPIAAVDVPTPLLVQQLAAARFEEAAGRTHSLSDQVAFHLDAWLVTHPDDVKAAAADYPDWPAEFAAIKKDHSGGPA